MHSAIVSASSALEWLATQASPLALPQANEAAWGRRLIEACAWLCVDPLMNLATAMPDAGDSSPDLTDPAAGIRLTSEVRDPGRPLVVDPALMAQNKGQSMFVSVSAPADKLGLPQPLTQAMSDGTLKYALSFYADGVFFLPIHGSLLESLIEIRGAAHPWVAEHCHNRLDHAFPGTSPAHLGHRPRF